jgi:LytS/YehU family sensor histidine kinase
VAATEIAISASGERSKELVLRVRNSADGAAASARSGAGTGTGLARLRERLSVLYGASATLTAGPVDDGYEAVLVVPQSRRAHA